VPEHRASTSAAWLTSDRFVDVAIAGAAATVTVVGTYFAGRHQQDATPFDALAWSLLVAGPLALIFRRQAPVAVLAVTLGCVAAYTGLGYPWGPIFVALIIAFFTAVVSGHRLAGIISLPIGLVSTGWLGSWLGRADAPTATDIVAVAAWLLLLLSVAEFVRLRHQRSLELARGREEEDRRRASEERLQIARELHDVLAHNVSLINVQAGVALHLIDDASVPASPEVRDALAVIKDASKEALDEMRSILGILRATDDGSPPRDPVQGLAQLPALVERTTAAGLPVTLTTIGDPSPSVIDAGADLAGFRIVQEALTNALRHSGATATTVLIDFQADAVVVEVTDDGRGAPTGPTATATGRENGSGNGLAGMRERVAALGGEIAAGNRLDGPSGFRVWARLPNDPASVGLEQAR
jgi:signal transduction histidine kinase